MHSALIRDSLRTPSSKRKEYEYGIRGLKCVERLFTPKAALHLSHFRGQLRSEQPHTATSAGSGSAAGGCSACPGVFKEGCPPPSCSGSGMAGACLWPASEFAPAILPSAAAGPASGAAAGWAAACVLSPLLAAAAAVCALSTRYTITSSCGPAVHFKGQSVIRFSQKSHCEIEAPHDRSTLMPPPTLQKQLGVVVDQIPLFGSLQRAAQCLNCTGGSGVTSTGASSTL